MSEKCQARFGVTAGQECGARASFEENGRWYCAKHSPSKYIQRQEAARAKRRLADAALELLKAARVSLKASHEARLLSKAEFELVRDAIAKAEEEAARLKGINAELLEAARKAFENLDATLRGARPIHNELKLANELRAAIAKAECGSEHPQSNPNPGAPKWQRRLAVSKDVDGSTWHAACARPTTSNRGWPKPLGRRRRPRRTSSSARKRPSPRPGMGNSSSRRQRGSPRWPSRTPHSLS